jgi:SAM-dependent methyltransferase
MALLDLVKLKQTLIQNMDVEPVVYELDRLRENLLSIPLQVPVVPTEHLDYINSLAATVNNILEQIQRPANELENQLALIDNQITDLTRQLFAGNYELEERYGTHESIRSGRKIYISEETEAAVKQRILLHTSWRYPSLEIGCRDGEWTQHLVAADPLYIMDRHQEFIDSTVSKFPEVYQRRLRQYRLVDHEFSKLPQNQFAFVFSWGYFNYVSLDTMTQCLKQIHTLLRPGGTFMFSYNDGDTPHGAGMAENFARSYMPKSILTQLSRSLGFNVNNEVDLDPGISWLEISKPGLLHTIKAHQVFGEIIPIENIYNTEK